MATIRHLVIRPESYIRRKYNTENYVWLVEEGQRFKRVNFSLKELKHCYWIETLCVPSMWNEAKIRMEAQKYADSITESDINQYKKILGIKGRM